jgi:hypothetical protein
MPINRAKFSVAIAQDQSLKEGDIAVAVTWFCLFVENRSPLSFGDVCNFVEAERIRSNLNRARLKTALRARRDISTSNLDSLSIPLRDKLRLDSKYAEFRELAPPHVENSVLDLEDFAGSRSYVGALAKQINGAYQFQLFDCCAVMMRRLAEVLIIDAYDAKKANSEIEKDGNFQMLSGLIDALKSGKTFKISRNAPKRLDKLKIIGDTAAHSRTYITKKLDIDDFKLEYRQLIAELVGLASTHPSSTH